MSDEIKPVVPAVEAPVANGEPVVEAKPKPAVFGALAKKEKAIREQQKALQAERAAMEAQRAEVSAYQERRKTYKENPLAALEDAGISLEDLSRALVQNEFAHTPENQIQRVDQKIENLRKAQEEKERLATESARTAQTQREADAVAQVQAEITEHLTSDPEKYEYCNLYKDASEKLIFQAMQLYYEEKQEFLSYADAASKIETYWEGEVEKVLKAKKVQAKLKPEKSAPKTLTNLLTPPPRAALPAVSEAERMKRATAILENALNKK